MTTTVYTWLDVGHHDVLTPMIRLRAELSVDACIAEAVPGLLSQPVGKRAVMLWHACPGILAGIDNGATFLAQDPSDEAYETWLHKVFTGIQAAGIEVNRVIVEIEDGIGFWHLVGRFGYEGTANWFAQLWGSPAFQNLPPAVRALSLSAIQAGQFGAVVAWNQYASRVFAEALRETITGPACDVFGPLTKVSNYCDSRARFQIYDENGWPYQACLMGNEASPSCYLKDMGNRYTGFEDKVWRRLIDCVNYVRAQAVPCSPWVTFLGADYDLTAEMLRHHAEAGVSEFLYWFPDGRPATEHAFAADVFRSLQVRPRVELPELPFDAASIPHLPPIELHVCPAVNVEGVRRSMAWELYGRDMLTAEDLVELGYPRRRMSRGPLQRLLVN